MKKEFIPGGIGFPILLLVILALAIFAVKIEQPDGDRAQEQGEVAK